MPTEDSENDPPIIPANPVVVVQGVGHLSREFMREVGSLFWFMVQTLDETVERIRDGRVPFRASSFFRHCQRAGVGSVPLVGLVSFFLGLTMALLTGYQLQRFGTERLVPGLVAIAFTRELGPLITGIMLVLKSFLFGLLIGGIACYRGLSVKGGAAGVGTATTSSVVTSIATVIGFDTMYNIVYTVFFPT